MQNLIPLLSIFILALIPRLTLLFASTHPDPGWTPHWNLATGLLKYGTLGYQGERVTNIEPGYPFFIAVSRFISQEHLTGVLFFQIVAASLGAVYVFLLALEVTASRKAAWLAGIFFAFYPYLIGQSISIIEVSVFTTLLAASAFYYLRAQNQPGFLNGTLCGLFFGLTILVRTMVLPAFALCFAALLFHKKYRSVFSAVLVFLAVTAPWFLRSNAVDGSWIPPRGGWNLLQGNCPYSEKIIPAYNPDLLDAYVSQILEKERPDLIEVEKETDAVESDRLFKAKAYEFMKTHPWRTLKQRLKNAVYLFYPRIVPFYSMDENTRIYFTGAEDFKVESIPSRGLFRELAYSLSYTPLFILALIGMYLRRKKFKDDLVFYFIILNFTAVYALCWPAARLRVPMDFIFMIFAAYALNLWKKQNSPAG